MTYRDLWYQLAPVYGEGEAKAIARMVYEVRFALSLSDLYVGKDTQLSADDQTELKEISRRLLKREPVQYVLGQVAFCGRTFLVNKHVLIPRPETEELCNWICQSWKQAPSEILDVGTGSGCIAITLAAMFPEAHVAAWDISSKALAVACENAKQTHACVSFEQVDVLTVNRSTLTSNRYDLIVSNPPYVLNKERAKMEQNVVDYEPHTALFVPDEDPLLFYRAIGQYGQTALNEKGWLYFEINPLYANDLKELLSMMSYHDIEINTDQFGKQRMIRAQR